MAGVAADAKQMTTSALSLELITNTHDMYDEMIRKTVRFEIYLRQAARLGHVGVIKSLLGDEKTCLNYKEGQFRLAQRKLELFGDDNMGTQTTQL